ncbi:hypothetical protein JX266_013001 [Neoarthrinium moseri]|nr:hypothetical protein JX266_013001 [Neoarthrinium moseri]
MTNERIHDSTTSNVLAWSSQSAHMQHEPEDEAAAEVDEPPEHHYEPDFKRTAVRKQADHARSLLTKALHHESDDEVEPTSFSFGTSPSRRRSMNSTFSLASTADLTCDTGLTSPARTNTPSPPPPVVQLGRLNLGFFDSKPKPANVSSGSVKADTTPTKKATETTPATDRSKDPAVEALAKKRCISFACGPKVEVKKPVPSPQASLPKQAAPAAPEQPAQRRTCIKFACPSKPSKPQTPPQRQQVRVQVPDTVPSSNKDRDGSPATVRKYRSSSIGRSPRSVTPRRRHSKSPVATRHKKYLIADSADLSRDSAHFHEFASDEPQEDDWIRHNVPTAAQRLTINDTLRKEFEIRRLGREAEEEALQEEFDDEVEDDGEEDPDNVDEDDDVDGDDLDDFEDDQSGYGSDDDLSDGYNTDNEIGFADSDGDDDADDLELWTHGQASTLQLSGATPTARRPSLGGNRSDSSSSSEAPTRRPASREKTRRIKIRPGTPELPDSTDFVCGTLDEDRPLEDAYMSCIAQKRREKLHVIPQDIDPSFPTSEPEDEEEDKAAHETDDHVWIHGELEDLHHEHERADRRKKRSNNNSPKRYRSPPPKRHHSPAPKGRGRSPRRLFDRHSPRRLVSPALPSGRGIRSPPASPLTAAHGAIDFKTLAAKPGLTHTKSLPRPPALFPGNMKGQRRRQAAYTGARGHVRGAIDIVKGLEHKRQRRREKYIQKHCNRARKGQVAAKRPEPGKGAQRMRELGLHMAGKHGPDHYVLSI